MIIMIIGFSESQAGPGTVRVGTPRLSTQASTYWRHVPVCSNIPSSLLYLTESGPPGHARCAGRSGHRGTEAGQTRSAASDTPQPLGRLVPTEAGPLPGARPLAGKAVAASGG